MKQLVLDDLLFPLDIILCFPPDERCLKIRVYYSSGKLL